jgi:AcrR family transcriptional regulator
MILPMQNLVELDSDVAARIAAATAARRTPNYEREVRGLLDAALRVINRCGTTSRARVADIVAEAGLSNDAFYRYFPSKDALVAALMEDRAHRVAAAIARRMADASSPEEAVRRWVEEMLRATEAPSATSMLAVLSNSTNANGALPTGQHTASEPLAEPLLAPFAALGSDDPHLDAVLVTQAVVGRIARHLWAGTQPDEAEARHILRFCLATPAVATLAPAVEGPS